jgi:hypothetical protein
MKVKQKRRLMFGDLIFAACEVWGERRAARMVRFMTETRLVIFQRKPPFFTSTAKVQTV